MLLIDDCERDLGMNVILLDSELVSGHFGVFNILQWDEYAEVENLRAITQKF